MGLKLTDSSIIPILNYATSLLIFFQFRHILDGYRGTSLLNWLTKLIWISAR